MPYNAEVMLLTSSKLTFAIFCLGWLAKESVGVLPSRDRIIVAATKQSLEDCRSEVTSGADEGDLVSAHDVH